MAKLTRKPHLDQQQIRLSIHNYMYMYIAITRLMNVYGRELIVIIICVNTNRNCNTCNPKCVSGFIMSFIQSENSYPVFDRPPREGRD